MSVCVVNTSLRSVSLLIIQAAMGFKKTKITLQRSNIVAMFKATDSNCYGLLPGTSTIDFGERNNLPYTYRYYYNVCLCIRMARMFVSVCSYMCAYYMYSNIYSR